MRIRYQADNDLKRIIVDAMLRREPRIDFQTAQAAHLDNMDDEAVLRGRIAVQDTRNPR